MRRFFIPRVFFIPLRLLLPCLLLLLAGCASLPDDVRPAAGTRYHTLYFVYREWHTSLVLPAQAARAHSRYLREAAKGNRFVRVGWGDGDYFTGKNKSAASATRALFASGYSALQVLPYANNALEEIPPETRVPLQVSEKDMRELLYFIDRSFALDTQQQPVALPSYAENSGSFFLAKNDYGLFNNCNTWSAEALQAAGLPVTSRFRLTPQSVFAQAKAISEKQFETAATTSRYTQASGDQTPVPPLTRNRHER